MSDNYRCGEGQMHDGGWTEERTELLKTLWGTNLTSTQIATELGQGATKNVVIGKGRRLGLPARGKKRPVTRGKGVAAKERQMRLRIERANTIKVYVGPQVTADDHRALKGAAWTALAGVEPIPFMDLPDRRGVRCRWPVDGGYCGQASGEHTYCDIHTALAGRPYERGASK